MPSHTSEGLPESSERHLVYRQTSFLVSLLLRTLRCFQYSLDILCPVPPTPSPPEESQYLWAWYLQEVLVQIYRY